MLCAFITVYMCGVVLCDFVCGGPYGTPRDSTIICLPLTLLRNAGIYISTVFSVLHNVCRNLKFPKMSGNDSSPRLWSYTSDV